MYSVLSWIGLLVFLAGLVGSVCPQWTDFGWRDSVFGSVICLLTVLQFAYFHRLRCQEANIPNGSVAIVVAFDPENDRAALAGSGNRRLASWLDANAGKFSRIMTQEAVLWALDELGHLPKPPVDVASAGSLHGVEVERIHRHVLGASVRTLETLSCAMKRFGADEAGVLVLVAHDKHYERAYRDLRSLFKGRIVNPCIQGVPYSTGSFLKPILWAARELFGARPIEYWQRKGLFAPACRSKVAW